MVCRRLLDPVQVDGVVDVAEPVELVLAHRPAHGVSRHRLALVGGGGATAAASVIAG
jgi:hypothetical protein